ncbi:MAG: hypothetical protein KatS3mg003_1965 [Candidatus Nitrosocaldaceae archaeon]|nr:MAG: hypothetical protein KatS3mg003_1965 [Candidatus Nitrosocaldaceae archaeon]
MYNCATMYKSRFYKRSSVWCYDHNRFEDILEWRKHNNSEEFISIIDSITPRVLTKQLGNIEFIILLHEGLICPDTDLPRVMKHILPSIIDKLLKEDNIHLLEDYYIKTKP